MLFVYFDAVFIMFAQLLLSHYSQRILLVPDIFKIHAIHAADTASR